MEAVWIQILVPIAILAIMMSMGLELTLADFRRTVQMPKPVAIGLVLQLVMLPLLGFAFASLVPLRTEIALGVVILTACPGGAPSNVFSYLAGANIALSITLTALSSVITVFTIPLWVNFGLAQLDASSADFRLPLLRTFAQLMGITVIPVAIGMLVRARAPDLAARIRPHLKRGMGLLMVGVITLIVANQWEIMLRDMPVAAPSALVLVTLAIASAFGFAKAFRLGRRDSFTVSIEVGMQNGALATMIAINLLDRPELVIFPGCYALLVFAPVGLWTIAYRMRTPAVEA